MKIRICKVEQYSSGYVKVKTYYQVERKHLFFWNPLLHQSFTSLEEAEKWAEKYIGLNGKLEQTSIVKEYNVQ